MDWNWISHLERYRRQGEPLVLLTVIGGKGSVPRDAGAKMIVLGDGRFHGTIGGGRLEQLATTDALECLRAGAGTKSVTYPLGAKAGQCCGGSVEILFEVLNTGPKLYLFGAGHVGQALARTMAGTPFSVHIVDERAEWIGSDSLPEESVRFHGEWEDFMEDARWDPSRTYVAIMTHRHDLDQKILEALLKKQTRYLGMIGSDTKWRRFRERLIERGFSENELSRVRCPIGLKIPGKAPQEIAVGIASALLQEHYGVR